MITIRGMRTEEAPAVSSLMRDVFNEFVAPQYSARGRKEFIRASAPERIASGRYEVLVAEDTASHELAGMLLLETGDHITMLFVKKAFQRRGIGKKLIEHVEHLCRTRSIEKLTVNAAPNAVSAYRAYGFVEAGRQRTVRGVLFTPMEKSL